MTRLRQENWFTDGFVNWAYLPSHFALGQHRGWRIWYMRVYKSSDGGFAWFAVEKEQD